MTPKRGHIVAVNELSTTQTIMEKISTKRELTKPPQKRHWRVAFDVTKENPKSPFKSSLISKIYS